MFCPKCAQWNAGSAPECTACGASLLPENTAVAPVPPQHTFPAPTVPAMSQPPTIPPMQGPTPHVWGQMSQPTPSPALSGYPSYQVAEQPYLGSGPVASHGPQYPAQPYPNYPQYQPPHPNNAPYASPSNAPPAYPTYSPLPPSSPYGGSPPAYGAGGGQQGYGQMPPAYGGGYPGQAAYAPNQCKVCGNMLAYSVLTCPFCTVPLGMIANPYDPTVTTYLDARALNAPGTSPVFAAPGAYAGRGADPLTGVPEEVRKGWNWAAALNSTLWAFTHRAPGWGLLGAIGLFCWLVLILGMSTMSSSDLRGGNADDQAASLIVGLIFIGSFALLWVIKTLYLGMKGNVIAWRSGRYTTVSQLKFVQRQWTKWSLVVFITASAVLFTATYIAGKH